MIGQPARIVWFSCILAVLLGGCRDIQSVLVPQGPAAARIATLSWILFVFGTVVLLIVLAAVWLAIRGSERTRRYLSNHVAVVAGGVVFPAVTLTALLGYGIWLTHASTSAPRGTEALPIEVVGEQWWWRIAYPGRDGSVASANELRIPVGQPVMLSLKAADVIHSFWVPSLGGKVDMIPGRTTHLLLQADTAGVVRGQCAEYCGGPHALMALEVVAMPPADFDAWLTGQSAPGSEPGTDTTRRGRDLFLGAGCGACHAVRGTEARGVIGPDLTHMGSRRSVGLDTLPLSAANATRFIADGQHIKPGNRMPPFRIFSRDELDAVAAYLVSLR